MDTLDFFKLQAKNFMRDFKTQYTDETGIYQYTPRFFPDIDEIIVSFDINEDDFTLMNCQHIIARLSGFEKWSDLLHASKDKLELGKLLFENRHIRDSLIEDWETYRASMNQDVDDRTLISIFKLVYLDQNE